MKIAASIGSALGLALIGWAGYDATASEQTADATNALLMSMMWLPSGLTLAAIVLIFINPINAHRHGVIRRRLDSLASRASF